MAALLYNVFTQRTPCSPLTNNGERSISTMQGQEATARIHLQTTTILTVQILTQEDCKDPTMYDPGSEKQGRLTVNRLLVTKVTGS